MKPEETFQELIEKILSGAPSKCFVGTVSNINIDSGIATIKRDERPDIFGVRLNSIVAPVTDKILICPASGSKVLCCQVDNDPKEAAIIKYSEIESVIISIGESSIKIDKDNIALNNGRNGGLIFIQKLLEGLNKNNQILQKILSVVSTQVVEPGNGSPSALQAALKVALSGLSIGDFSKIENEKVKH